MNNKYMVIIVLVGFYLIFAIVSGFYLMGFNKGVSDLMDSGIEKDKNNLVEDRSNGVVVNIWTLKNKFDILRENKIKYLIIDVGDTGSNGRLITPDKDIKHFLEKVKDYEKENNYNFVLLPYSEVNTYNYNFNDDFQKNFFKDYLKLVSMGFDGVYIDIEPIRETKEYLEFLDKVREEFSFVSVYSGAVGLSNSSNNKWEWSLDFFEKVCNSADLIFVPGYDSWLSDEEKYKEYIKRQVMELSSLKADCDFVLVVPTHKDSPETLKNALKSYSKVENNKFIGVAIFSEWTMSKKEWEVFREFIN